MERYGQFTYTSTLKFTKVLIISSSSTRRYFARWMCVDNHPKNYLSSYLLAYFSLKWMTLSTLAVAIGRRKTNFRRL